jgi:hypothetical protein
MYQSLTHFLQNFSVESPILWALLVMIVIGGTGLSLYVFWELLLKGLFSLFSRRNSDGPDQG